MTPICYLKPTLQGLGYFYAVTMGWLEHDYPQRVVTVTSREPPYMAPDIKGDHRGTPLGEITEGKLLMGIHRGGNHLLQVALGLA